ncbi:3'-5' DNA helicase [Elasticomyces elasticus]|nr:3'-5' DNA helicase [Elasticomyces elasticus]
MSESEDFDDFDDSELLQAATQVEASQEFFEDSPRPVKRRKTAVLDGVDQEDNDDTFVNTLDHEPVRGSADEDEVAPDETFAIPKKPPRHKIHIPAQAESFTDRFSTQAPPTSSCLWQIRGPIWQKPPKSSPPPFPGCTEVQSTRITGGAVDVPSRERNSDAFNYLNTRRTGLPNTRQSVGATSRVVSSTTPKKTTNVIVDKDDGTVIAHNHSGPSTTFNKPSKPASSVHIEDELADLPSDAFASSSSSPTRSPDRGLHSSQPTATQIQRHNLTAPQNGLRQTTLFGGTVQNLSTASQANKKHNWPLVNKDESPTHHKLKMDALATWVYPTNLGTIRDYQYNIVARGLFHNLLVALPTGLGKTFIAATIMLNWYRWTKEAQIVFVAPTKPLVSQQVDACYNIVGIPKSDTVLLTGNTPPGVRAEEWLQKRVFFMTPQTVLNDLKTGIADPKRIVLIVVDEAHRATGNYAYNEVIKFLRRFNQSFRVLALTATPGSNTEAVQQVIDGLDISRVEIRTESSLDIRQYIHTRNTEVVLFDPSMEQEMVMDLFSKALQPVLSRLNSQNAYWARDPMQLTPYGLMQARKQWQASEAGRKAPMPLKAMVNSIFTILSSLAHGINLLKYHGIGPFFHSTILNFRQTVESGQTKSKYSTQIANDENFSKMCTRIQGWINNPDFIGHPKLEYLRSVVLNHFLDAGEGNASNGAPPSATRIMVFAHFRDSAEEIVRVLKRNEPMIRPHVFVGQAGTKGSEGMDQKRQLDIIQKFKSGIYNTLVATSIGEEGLDIGEIDLIVCYDSSSSPIRMLQRMGRTGRKRAGNIVLLQMRGKEANDFENAKDNYEKMQAMIANGSHFNYHEDRSPRIIPKDVRPVVDKRIVVIPIENTQGELPEPKKRGRPPKRPPKKFHMPDGVRTGFVKASKLGDSTDAESGREEGHSKAKAKATARRTVKPTSRKQATPEPELAQLPYLEDVLLTAIQEKELERRYQYVHDEDTMQTVQAPQVDALPHLFREPGPTKYVRHGRATMQLATTLGVMHGMDDARLAEYNDKLHMSDLEVTDGDHNMLVEEEHPNRLDVREDSAEELEGQENEPQPAQPRKKYRATGTAIEALPSSAPPTPAFMRLPTQGIDLGTQDTSGEDEDDREIDSDLDDFIVRSDQPVELVSSSLPTELSTVKSQRVPASQVTIDGGSEEELPEVGILVKGPQRAVAKVKSKVQTPRKKSRRVIEDDSDE